MRSVSRLCGSHALEPASRSDEGEPKFNEGVGRSVRAGCALPFAPPHHRGHVKQVTASWIRALMSSSVRKARFSPCLLKSLAVRALITAFAKLADDVFREITDDPCFQLARLRRRSVPARDAYSVRGDSRMDYAVDLHYYESPPRSVSCWRLHVRETIEAGRKQNGSFRSSQAEKWTSADRDFLCAQ